MARHRYASMLAALVLSCSLGFTQPLRTDQAGDPLPEGAIARLGTDRWRVESQIVAVAMPNANSAVTVSDKDLVQFWDMTTGKEMRRVAIADAVSPRRSRFTRIRPRGSVGLSRDGKWLVFLGNTGAVHVWDLTAGKEIFKLAANMNEFFVNVAISNDGGTVVATSPQSGSQILRVRGTEKPVRLGERNDGGPILSVGFLNHLSSDGKALLQMRQERDSSMGALTLVFYDTASGAERYRIAKLPVQQALYLSPEMIKVSENLETLAILQPDGVVFASGKDGKELGRISDRGFDYRQSIMFSPDGKSLIGTSQPHKSLTIWEVPSAKVLFHVGNPPTREERLLSASRLGLEGQMTTSDDGQTLLWCADSKLAAFDLKTGKRRSEASGHPGPVEEAWFAINSAEVLTRAGDAVIRRWDAKSGRLVDQLHGPPNSSTFVLSPDGRLIVASDRQGDVRLFEAISLKEKREFSFVQMGAGGSMRFSPDSKLLALAGPGARTVHLVDVATGERKARIALSEAAPEDEDNPDRGFGGRRGLANSALRVRFSTDGKRLIVASPRVIILWDVVRHRQLGQIPMGEDSLEDVVLSPDCRSIAVETPASTWVYELATLQKRFRLRRDGTTKPADPLQELIDGREGSLRTSILAYSPDSRLLARADKETKVRIWDTWTGRELGAVSGHRGDFTSLAFSPDGRKLATGSADTTALVWDVEPIRAQMERESTKLDDSNLESAWRALIEDAPQAYEAIRLLALDPGKSVALFTELLEPAKGPDAKLLANLIADLANSKFAMRERAVQELERLGEGATSALRLAAEKDASADVRKAAKKLLDKQRPTAPTRDQLRAIRAIEILERIAAPAAIDLLKKLAGGTAEITPTPEAQAALSRIAPPKP